MALAISLLLSLLYALYVVQANQPQCGAYSLFRLLELSDSNIRYESVRNALPRTQFVSFADLQRASAKLGLRLDGQQINIAALKVESPLGILALKNYHFVALLGYGSNGPIVADSSSMPWNRTATWSYARLEQEMTGALLRAHR
jgi:ABC-type bacteriocin/lantibiotic exporter with double-glycine peptidase domain